MGMDASRRGEQERKAAGTYLPSPIWSQWTKTLEESVDTEDTSKGWGEGSQNGARGDLVYAAFLDKGMLDWPKSG